MEWKAIFEPDDDGWKVTVPDIPDGCLCITWGKSIAQARTRMREALAAALEDDAAAASAVFVEKFKIPEATGLRRLRTRRKKLEVDQDSLAQESASEARRLVKAGYSVRDVAALVGLSHQRVSQLAS